ncbi:hypothetical protein GGI23_000398 [Coemansia sp. RSA 2559]|nr:hypothetical protein GGI23_000398 [Coemansia sp. RSA 2559]
MDDASSNSSVAHAQSNKEEEEECCRCCCKHRCCSKHTDEPVSAEQLADDAAESAGWNIRWPRIRTMADSPDLQRLHEPSSIQQQQQQQQQQSRDAPSGRSAWTQVRRFVTEITEVFGRHRSDATTNDEGECNDSTEDATALLEAAVRIDKQHVRTGAHQGVASEGEEEHARTWRGQAMGFARGYPLLALLCGWLVMVSVDWLVTSEAIPRLVSLLTARPWSPFSESFVLRAALQQPGLLGDGAGIGISQAVKTRLVDGELMLDDFIWRTQAFVASSLVPLTHSHALLWLCIALLSLGALRRCSKLGPRAALLCIAYFVAADYALWNTLGPAHLDYIGSGPLIVQPSYECNSGACTLARIPLPQAASLPRIDYSSSSSSSSSTHTYFQPSDVRSPFAEAVQQAMQMRSALVERRTERLQRLHGWRQRVKQTVQDQNRHKSGRISVIATLATLSFYICLTHWATQYVSASALRVFMLLFGMDVLLHGGFASIVQCVLAHSNRIEADVLRATADADASLHAFLVGTLGCAQVLYAHTMGFLSCVAANGVYSIFDSHTPTSGRLLPIHVLNVTALLALRECAYVIHNMRAWYAAVVRERRRGPSILTGRRAGSAQITVSRCDGPVAPAPTAPTSHRLAASMTRYAAYAHRTCFMCLGGFCERCLLSMEIWPTADSSPASGAVADLGESASTAQQRLPLVAAAAAAAAAAATMSQHTRRRTKTSTRHGRSAPAAGNTAAASPSMPSTAASASSATDSLAADTTANGLPPLYTSLQTIADLVDQQPALSGTDASPDMFLSALPGATSRSGVAQQGHQTGARRGRTVDVWIASSVAHCPCRLVHGVGPSSFVAKPAGGSKADAGEEMPPAGTPLALSQYARELKSLGLVRSVDPVSAVHADDDPAASVLPLIFGRFALPENPQAVAAANALLQSSGGHTPGDVPFLRTGLAPRQGAGLSSVQSQVSDLATGTSAELTSGGDGTHHPSRILAKPTPLSTVRSMGSGTFRLCVDAVLASQGAVNVSIIVTPVLAHLLLTHPRTAPTAAVCVPASLVSAIVSRTHRSQASTSRSAKPKMGGNNVGSSGPADIDPFVDHSRVQLLRSDIVVRVNGSRWTDFELDRSGTLNRPLSVRSLPPNHMHSICVSVCGMRSEELTVVIPAIDASTTLFGMNMLNGSAGGAKLSGNVEDVAARVEQLDVLHKQQQMAQQKLRKVKRDFPRQIQNLQNELEAVRRVLSRHADSSARFEPQRAHLVASIAAVAAETADLRAQLDKHARDLDTLADVPASREESVSGSASRELTGFNVLATLDDHEAVAEPLAAHQGHHRKQTSADPSSSHVIQSGVDQQALAEYQDIEARARRAQNKYEDSIHGLKADRAKWMAQLSQLTQRLSHLDQLIDPVRRELKEVTRLVAAGANMESTLHRKLQIEEDDHSAGGGDGKRPRQKRKGKKAEIPHSAASNGLLGDRRSGDMKALMASRDDLSRSLDTLREALKAERTRINELMSLSAFKK